MKWRQRVQSAAENNVFAHFLFLIAVLALARCIGVMTLRCECNSEEELVRAAVDRMEGVERREVEVAVGNVLWRE